MWVKLLRIWAQMRSNFTHIASYDRALFRLSSNAERYFPGDPNTALIKLRQFGELLAQQVASRFGLYTGSEETQLELLRRLESNGDLERARSKSPLLSKRRNNSSWVSSLPV